MKVDAQTCKTAPRVQPRVQHGTQELIIGHRAVAEFEVHGFRALRSEADYHLHDARKASDTHVKTTREQELAGWGSPCKGTFKFGGPRDWAQKLLEGPAAVQI